MTTKPTTEAVDALSRAARLSFDDGVFAPHEFIRSLSEEGFTIAPTAPVTDEKLREAVAHVKDAYGDNCWLPYEDEDGAKAFSVIESALSELAHRRAEQTWQPIETAPKDGTKVLLGRFVLNCPEGKNGRMAVDFWHTVNPHGYEGWGKFNTRYWPATHWMPLPTPPKED